MKGLLFDKIVAREERRLGVGLDYFRELGNRSGSAFMRMAGVGPMSWYRRAASADVYAVARIACAQRDDCGPCLQIAVNLAMQDGADEGVVRAVLARDVESLSSVLQTVYEWTMATLDRSPEAKRLGVRLDEQAGDRSVRAELALGISVGRMFTTLKRALGDVESCAVNDVRLPVMRRAS